MVIITNYDFMRIVLIFLLAAATFCQLLIMNVGDGVF